MKPLDRAFICVVLATLNIVALFLLAIGLTKTNVTLVILGSVLNGLTLSCLAILAATVNDR